MPNRMYIAYSLLCIGIAYTCFIPEQRAFIHILTGYSLAFMGYALLLQGKVVKHITQVSIMLTLIACGSFPNLSDDIYRFIWDGYCTWNGISPYAFLPIELVDQGLDGLTPTLLKQLNSPSYYSIYPTFSQFLFVLPVAITEDIAIQSFILKVIYGAMHLIGYFCAYKAIVKRGLAPSVLAYYFLNPLVVIEGIGNLHAEVNMVALCAIALYFWDHKKVMISGLFLALAISVKLVPLFLMGYFLYRWRLPSHRKLLLWTGMWTLLLFIPVIYGLFSGGFLDSVDLYFRKFEFNASIYYILRYFGYQISGYNLIAYLGPSLFIGFVITAFTIWHKNYQVKSGTSFFQQSLLLLTIYFFCATIVHPWYLIGLCGLNIFVRMQYILAWSFLIILTYINYSFIPYEEQLWIVAVEYSIVILLFIMEHKKFSRPVLPQ